VSSPARHPATWPGTNLTRSPARKYDRALARPENWMIGAPSRDDSVSPAPLGLRPSGPGHSGPPPSWLASRFPPWSGAVALQLYRAALMQRTGSAGEAGSRNRATPGGSLPILAEEGYGRSGTDSGCGRPSVAI
jgi:hypothetical protein